MMWKAVIADDEGVIVNGLKKLIDWEGLNVHIVGEAKDGFELKAVIEAKDPDLVIADIMMPKMTGLEVIQWYHQHFSKAKFIFISGYQEFSYAREAIKYGAVDYLLKPVAGSELKDSICKAVQMLNERNTVQILGDGDAIDLFKAEMELNTDHLQDISLNNSKGSLNEERWSGQVHIDFEKYFGIGIAVGFRPDHARKLKQQSFSKYNLMCFSVYNYISEYVTSHRYGYIVDKDECAQYMIILCPKNEINAFSDSFVIPLKQDVEERFGIVLCAGIGMPAGQESQLKNAYKTSKVAFNLYYFEEKTLIDFEKVHKKYTVSFDEYTNSVEDVFRAIVARDDTVMEKIDHVMDNIESIHYGNRYAAQARTMYFTGELGSKLYKYHMLQGDFYKMQDALQQQVETMKTFRELRACIRSHYEKLISEIYETGKSKDKLLIEQVKKYIRENYAKDLSVKELSQVACVSQNYFSAMFKRETGQNYKAYLTSIRMEAALKLLQETDSKTYEISEQVGYNNVRRFVDAFKQIYSVSPMEYKKALKHEK